MHTDSDQGEFIEPTPRARRNIVVTFVVALLVGVTSIQLGLPAYSRHLEQLGRCEQFHWIYWTLVGMIGLGIPFALVYWVLALRVLHHGQWPLPGAWVLRRTPIKRGAEVRLRAYAMFVAGAIVLAGMSFAGYKLGDFRNEHEARACTTDASPKTGRSPRWSRSASAAPVPAGPGTTSR